MPDLRLASLVVLAALGAAPAARADQAAAPAGPVPADLAVYGDKGIQLAGASLFDKKVDAAVLDPVQDLIWFVSNKQLQVIDLRDAKRTPVVIAKGVTTTSFALRGLSSLDHDTDYIGVFAMFTLEPGKKPKVAAEQGAYAEVDPESDAQTTRAVKKIKIVGTKWLTAQKGRVGNPVPPERAPPPNVKLPSGIGECDDTDQCGSATWLGAAPYQLIVVEQSCGDACHVGCALYDPAKKQYAAPMTAGGWGAAIDKDALGACWGYVVEPGNGHYAAVDGARVCSLGAKMTCTDLTGWVAFGWVNPAAPAAPAGK